MKALFSLVLILAAQSALGATCRDFTTQEEAQKYHDEQGGNTRLDRDHDGEACECLEGGSAYGSVKCQN